MTVWKTTLNSALPCILILFFGAWSDRNRKRKPCILLPLIGQTLMAISLLLCVYFDETPIEIAIFIQIIYPCLTGGNFMLTMGIFSYINDITEKENRTLRIGIVSMIQSIGEPLGMALSGLILKKIGVAGALSISTSFYLLAVLYGIFILREVPTKQIESRKSKNKSFVVDFFNPSHIKETLALAFKKGENRRRLKISTLMAVVFIVVGPQFAEKPEFYLFTRYNFNWSEVEYSFFSTYAMTTQFIGTSVLFTVFSTILKIDDAVVGALSNVSRVASNFVYAFAQLPWHMFIGPLAEIAGGLAPIAMRSIASKIVSSSESGKVNSLFGIVESFAPLIYSPLIAATYRLTLTTMPGAFFILDGLVLMPGIALFVWIYVINKADPKHITEHSKKEEKF